MTDCWLSNAGDGAIACGTQRLVRRHAPDAAIVHAAYEVEAVGHLYPDLEFVPPLDSLLGTKWGPAAPGWEIAGKELVETADLVISQGGGFLREGYQPWARIAALAQVARTHPNLILLGQTIGGFDRTFARRSLGEIMRAASHIVVRDPPSVLHAIDLGADARRVVLGGDVSLALIDDVSAPPPPHPLPVSVVLSANSVPGVGDDRADAAQHLLREILRVDPDVEILLWSSAQWAGDSADQHVVSAAWNGVDVTDRARVKVIAEHVTTDRMVDLARRSSGMVSMRFHPALLAAAQGTPTVLLLDDQKAGAFDGTRMEARTVRAIGLAGAIEAAAIFDGNERRWSGNSMLAPMLDRLAVTEAALEQALAVAG